jgi:antitoxin (DNA-binding transcriptional repressor) of toxin-antitoxin stability system
LELIRSAKEGVGLVIADGGQPQVVVWPLGESNKPEGLALSPGQSLVPDNALP